MRINEFPIDNHFKFFYSAYLKALESPGTGGKTHSNFRLGASIVSKKILLTSGYNSYKTHPKLLAFYKFPFSHAESSAILSLGTDNCRNTNLYVVRIKKNKDLGLAKPCKDCMKFISFAGIKIVYYSTENGYECISI